MDTKLELPAVVSRPNVTWKVLATTLAAGAAIITAVYRLNPTSFANVLTFPDCPVITIGLDSWLEHERPIALQSILDNIGASGPRAAGAQPGIVVASPSKTDPDYFFTWTRDSALTVKTLIDELIISETPGLEAIIEDYINAQARIQGIEKSSGGLCTGGLGEAKFNVDGTAFTGDWGRPQRDGPALRVIALTAYARRLISKDQSATASSIIWPIIQNDLSYVTEYWNESTFDLWEEVRGASFFTTAMQYRALIEGLRLARDIGHGCSHCESEAPQILCFLQSYWTGSYILSNTESGRSGKDINSILTSTHMFDIDVGCDAATFQPCSDLALANHKAVTHSFRSVYPINKGIPAGVGVAVGRYSEDLYMGGNPWYLGAFAAAEMLYQAVYQWKRLGFVTITRVSLGFFRDVYPGAAIGTFVSASPEFDEVLQATTAYADSFMANAQKYTPADGSLAEQYSRNDGRPASAKDLTWSYAALLTASSARNGSMPASWGASAAKLPLACSTGSAKGPCSTATNTAWPSRTAKPPCATPILTTIMFSLRKPTRYGQDVFLSGNISQLGSWDVNKALALSAGKYTEKQPLWYTFERLPAGTRFEYKYVLKGRENKKPVWETGGNRQFTVPATCEVSVVIHDDWR